VLHYTVVLRSRETGGGLWLQHQCKKTNRAAGESANASNGRVEEAGGGGWREGDSFEVNCALALWSKGRGKDETGS
jgi:hypothetical protein